MSHDGQKDKGELGQDSKSLEEATNQMTLRDLLFEELWLRFPYLRAWYRWRRKCIICQKRGVHHRLCPAPKDLLDWPDKLAARWVEEHETIIIAMWRQRQ